MLYSKDMRLLLVNNDSDTWEELRGVTHAAGYEVTPVHCSTIGAIDPRGYDMAVLSGGWWYDDPDELLHTYAEELAFIRSSPIPVLGICLGMQLMHVSLDQAVPLLDEPQSGYKLITVTTAGQTIGGLPATMNVFKNHTRAVVTADPAFQVLATSPGHVEMMLHRTRPLLGVQFHPEVGPIDEAADLLHTLIQVLLPQRAS